MIVDTAQLSLSERIQLVEDLWDSIITDQHVIPLTQSQRDELDQRLATYRQNPQAGRSWEQAKTHIKQSVLPQ